ncbi:MAG: NAD(P)-dependent oxidoreductase [Planctomycetota bacterium]
MNILIADKLDPAVIERLGREHSLTVVPDADGESLAAAAADAKPEILIVRSTKVTAAVFDAAPTLRMVIRAGAGVDNIDSDTASARGVAVCNCPGTNAVAVAELAIGLLVACDRRIPDQQQALLAGRWDKPGFAKARGLKGRTLGIVGVGAIGREVITRAKAFGVHIIAWSRSLTPEAASDLGTEFGGSSRDDLLAMLTKCDAVSLHVALSDDTRHLADAEFFAALPDGAIVINTARGGVLDEAALRDAVNNRGFRAGLDVHETQPKPTDTEFDAATISQPGIYGTHHCGASTAQAQAAVGEAVVAIVRSFADNGHTLNCVNADRLKTATA